MTEGPTDGFITLHRRIQDHAYWHDPERFRAWIDLLFMAAWKDHERVVEGRRVEFRRGEFLASERYLRNRWRWSRGKVRRFLEAAQQANEIEPTNSTSGGTIYRVVNYDTYQPARPTNRPTSSTTNGPPTDQREVREEGKEVTTTPPVGPPQSKPKPSRSIRLPDPWEPNDGHAELAGDLKLDLDIETKKFRDHAKANGRTLKDWDAGFRNWLRKSVEFQRKQGTGPPRTDEDARDAQRRAEAARRHTERQRDELVRREKESEAERERADAWWDAADSEKQDEVRREVRDRVKTLREAGTRITDPGLLMIRRQVVLERIESEEESTVGTAA